MLYYIQFADNNLNQFTHMKRRPPCLKPSALHPSIISLRGGKKKAGSPAKKETPEPHNAARAGVAPCKKSGSDG